MKPKCRPISKCDLLELLEVHTSICISLYVQTSPSGRDATNGHLELKCLLSKVDEHLRAEGRRWDEIADVLGRALALVDNPEFWKHQREGLAIFMTKGLFRMFKLPIRVPTLEVVAKTFHVTPLLQLLEEEDETFYVLSLSDTRVRLFKATKNSFDEMSIKGIPLTISEAFDDDRSSQNPHQQANRTINGRTNIGILQENSVSDLGQVQNQADYRRLYKKVDAAIQNSIGQNPLPMVLAGNAYLLLIYRKMNTYANLVIAEVHGAPDRKPEIELHRAAWEVAAKHFAPANKSAKESFQYALAKGAASYNPNEITKAATEGRIDKLFFASG